MILTLSLCDWYPRVTLVSTLNILCDTWLTLLAPAPSGGILSTLSFQNHQPDPRLIGRGGSPLFRGDDIDCFVLPSVSQR